LADTEFFMTMPRPIINLPSLVTVLICCALIFSSCSKSAPGETVNGISSTKPIAVIKLNGVVVPGATKKLTISVSNLGVVQVVKDVTVSTIGAGLEMDAQGILPASMITPSGITVTGDSVLYNGITVTNKTLMVTHGDLLNSIKLYGNLAYATVTFGDGTNPAVTTLRIPFFLYYKATEPSGSQMTAHAADLFGIGPGYNNGSKYITSPLSYLPVTGGQISGFKLSLVNFNSNTSQAALLTVGLTPADLEASAGFNLHPLSPLVSGGYANYITGTIVYNGTTLIGPMAFSTAYASASVIQDPKFTGAGYSSLAANSSVRIVTNNGFNYLYTVSNAANASVIEAPTNSGENRSIFGIDFFVNNEFLVDYTNHQIGLKNN